MSKLKPKVKNQNLTSKFAHLQVQSIQYPNITSRVLGNDKELRQQPINKYPKEFVQNLILRLLSLQQKQKQTEVKFEGCLRSLRIELQQKQKNNQTLNEEIKLIKKQLNCFKKDVEKAIKRRQKDVKSSKSLSSNSRPNSKLYEKQNISPYLIQSSRKTKNTLAIGQFSSRNSSKLQKMAKVTFKLDDFLIDSRLQNIENEDYNAIRQTRAFQQSTIKQQAGNHKISSYPVNNRDVEGKFPSASRKNKSKSFSSFLKSRLFSK